ncbi:Acetyltransferase (GNAT) family protein [Fictibacillus solisalsi]|uniref:Acetyltransferase (GNAT) family protein n=1 Tax=Fictibacillus solisalsi TaxID=459525 RepID=A0A1H0C9T9_9BACL|nr:GNAT family N-acetyltransferase [Fictibacillus solisalsi]SDN54645.1 Acetyltransferase (GNAT) family protein [Fictibacillus solisalsi]
MLTFKKFSTLSFEEAVHLFNEGFKYYFTDIHLTVDALLKKMANEELSPERSLVVYDQDKPVGFVLNGFRTINGQQVSWNGGTGIVPGYRGKGTGKELMKACMELYKQEGVNYLMLEAISENTKAIKLYEKMGYKKNDDLIFYVSNESLSTDAFSYNGNYNVVHALPQEVGVLDFYNHFSPWQTQAQGLASAEAVVVKSGDEPVGYALYRCVRNSEGKIESIVLYQCEGKPDINEKEDVILCLLHSVFQPALTDCKRMTFNFPKSNEPACRALQNEGFSTTIEQVHMSKTI